MDTLLIKETPQALYSVLLPVCDASILARLLNPALPFVTLIAFRSEQARKWIEENLPPLFDEARRVESIQVTSFEMNVRITTADFLERLPSFLSRGLDLIQSHGVIPPNLSIHELKPESKARVFREVGIELEFYLPHPHEHALATSPSREVLEQIVSVF